MSDKEANNIAAHIVASEQMDKIESYTERGRQFGSVSDEYPKEQFVAEMKKWASAPLPWPPITRLNDVEAELQLRKVDPPITAEVLEAFAVIEAIVGEKMKTSGLTKQPVTWTRKSETIRQRKSGKTEAAAYLLEDAYLHTAALGLSAPKSAARIGSDRSLWGRLRTIGGRLWGCSAEAPK
jgi:hypothetical protein